MDKPNDIQAPLPRLWAKYPNVWKEDPNTLNGEHWMCGFVPLYLSWDEHQALVNQAKAEVWREAAQAINGFTAEEMKIYKEHPLALFAKRHQDFLEKALQQGAAK